MRPALSALTAMAGVCGLAATSLGLIKVPDGAFMAAANRGRLRRLRTLARGDSLPARRRRRRLYFGMAAGVLGWLFTGWALAVVVTPVAALGLPILLSSSANKADIARLEAMSEWAQNLGSVLGVGIGIEQAIVASIRSTPASIRDEVGRLVARLQAGWDTVAALRAFADDLDDGTGDLLATALVLGASRRGNQLCSVLEGLAAAVRDEVKVRRTVDAEQAKGRTTARLVTLISAIGLGIMLLTPYADPYRTTSGQLVLAVLLTCYVACLVWMRRMTATPRHPRMLSGDTLHGRGQ